MIWQVALIIMLIIAGILGASEIFKFSGQPNPIVEMIKNKTSIGTNQTNYMNPLNDLYNGVVNIPWEDIKSALWGGVTGLTRWLVNYLILPGINYAMRWSTGNLEYSIPSWIAYLVLAIVFLIFLFKQWESITYFIYHNLMFVIVIILIIFILGVILSYLKII